MTSCPNCSNLQKKLAELEDANEKLSGMMESTENERAEACERVEELETKVSLNAHL
jgi:predicted nuclease with TOPRIM domain